MFFKKNVVKYKDLVNKPTLRLLCDVMGADLPKELKSVKNKVITKVTVTARYATEGSAVLFFGSKRKLANSLKIAQEKGVLAVFADKEKIKYLKAEEILVPVIPLDDAIESYGKYYDLFRNRSKGKIIAITGSVGKTTTRQYTSRIINPKKNKYVSTHNFNSTNIVSNNLRNNFTEDIDFYIQECGAGGPETIALSGRILTPDIAIITNIKPHHLNAYGTLENVYKDKIKLADSVNKDGVAIVNFDDAYLAAHDYKCRVASIGIDTDKDVTYRAVNIQQNNEILSFDVIYGKETVHIKANIIGKHNVYNILEAFAVGKELKYSDKILAKRIEMQRTKGIRQNVVHSGYNTLFMDCYNVCNDTIVAAVKTVSEFVVPEGAKKIAVIGGENKLGKTCKEVTYELGRLLKDIEVDEFVCVGRPGDDQKTLDRYGHGLTLYNSLKEHGVENVKYISTFRDLVIYLKENVKKDDLVLFKTVLWLNTFIAVDKVFGTNFCETEKYIKDEGELIKTDEFDARLVFEIDELYILESKAKNSHVVIPDTIDGYGIMGLTKGLYENRKDIKTVDLGNTLQIIGAKTFAGCTGLKEIVIPDSVLSIGKNAFKGCESLETVKFGKELLHIDEKAFAECGRLKKVFIPESVRYVAESAFDNGVEISYF